MKKVLLGMSGGVDSSVSAILLKEQGYDVIGITLELFGGTCCNTDAIVGAKQICNSIGIPHITYNLKEEFQCKVINNFIDEYSNQRTPNPCIECNKYMKFGAMYEKAKELGCDYIATGHYAKMEYSDEYGKYVLRKAKNLSKDQSYVLYNMPKQLLGKVLFPLGDFKSKEDVRKIAKEHNLSVASKPDSEDICFIPDGDYAGYIECRCGHPAAPGDIVWRDGSVVGRHNGALRYTIGQRKGLGVAMAHPVYVTGVDAVNNTVHLGEAEDLTATALTADDWIWSAPADRVEAELDAGGIRVGAKYRYRQKDQAATLTRGEDGQMLLTFDEPQRAIAPGQAVVVYRGDIVLGGGTVTGALK